MSSPKRPQRHDDQTYALAAEKFLEQIGQIEENPEELVSIGRALSELSAFDQAKELAEQCFDMTDDLMQTLLDGSFMHDAHAERVVQWVETAKLKPRRKIGDEVSFTHQGDKLKGEITDIQEDSANYTVCVPSLGHVKSGPGTRGLILAYEIIHPLARPVEEFELEPSM